MHASGLRVVGWAARVDGLQVSQVLVLQPGQRVFTRLRLTKIALSLIVENRINPFSFTVECTLAI